MALSATLNIASNPSLNASRVIQDLTYTAQNPGAAGNSITVRYLDPGAINQAISVSVVSNAITVNLATDGAGVLTSTAAQIKTAVDASSPAHALVAVAISGTGSTVQTAQSVLSLQNGFDTARTVSQNEPVPMVLAVTNSGGGNVTVDSCYPRVTSPVPAPAMAFDNPILPQPIVIAAAATAYIPFQAIIFGKETGVYVINVDVYSSISQLIATPSIAASITLS